MHTSLQSLTTLLLLLHSTSAFVPFAHSLHPGIDMSALSLQPLAPVDGTLPQPSPSPASSTLSDPLPTDPSLTSPLSSGSASNLESEHPDLKARQAQVTAPAAALPDEPTQVSPITTYEIDSYPPGGGAPVRVPIVYTQRFSPVPQQWELAGVGSIGMGSIVGQIGVVKTKRFVPFVVELEDQTEVPYTSVSFTA